MSEPDDLTHYMQAVSRLQAQLAEARAVLELLNVARVDSGAPCPQCGKDQGHAPDCRLAKVLSG